MTENTETNAPVDAPAQDSTDWKAEARKWEERAKANRNEMDGLKKQLEELDGTKSKLTEAEERLASLETENKTVKRELERTGWLRDAAKETGLPLDALEVVQGDSYESILSSAERIKSLVGDRVTAPRGGTEPDEVLPLNGDGIESALRKALGM